MKSFFIILTAIFALNVYLNANKEPATGGYAIGQTPDQVAKREAAQAKRAKDAEDERKFRQVVMAARIIKSRLNDPASLQLSSVIKTPEGAICVHYRATNRFGGVVSNHAVGLHGLVSHTDGDWNTHCAGKTGENFIHVRRAI